MGNFYDRFYANPSGGGGGGGTPLAYTKVGTASDGGALSLSLTVPAGMANNDLCLIAVIMRNGTVSSPPEGGGWTLDYSYDTETQEWLYLYSKVSTGTEPASWPITVTSTTSLAIAGVVRGFSGSASAQRYSGSPDTFTVPSIPAKEGELIVCVGAQSVSAGASGIGIPSNGDWPTFLDEMIAAVNNNDQAGSLSLQVFGATGPSYGFAYTSGGSTGFAQGLAVAYGV